MTEVLSPLISRLKRVEGWRGQIYIDTTGHVSIGYGHNLGRVVREDGSAVVIAPINGISERIGELILLDDVAAVIHAFEQRLTWFAKLDPVRRDVLVELGFNMGWGKVMSFPVFMHQLETGLYEAAAHNMRGWPWYEQVHAARAEPLVRMMQTGVRE